MLELSGAYLVATALIGCMIFFARRNQKQGWRRMRRSLWEAPPMARRAPVEAQLDVPFEHFSDLRRLQQSLAAESETVGVEEPVKSR
jgi:hypothetical protein